MILTLLVAFFSLIALMIIHEFGHFIIAKKFGAKVEEFGIGYPPRIFGKKFGETLYSVNLIPLGAFVRIFGEEADVHDAKSFSGLAIWNVITNQPPISLASTDGRILITTDFETGVLLLSATLRTGTSTLVSGK